MSVGVNPPKTPITKGSNGIAAATLPNVCKMPGPPAPFVPTPLPNIGKSGEKPDGYSKSVKIESNVVAIKGASFGSMGDMASKGTGGGLVSANTHGPCKFIGPGSMDVKCEGGNIQLLGDQMTNNGGGSGNPSNSATMMGAAQRPSTSGKSSSKCPPHEAGGEPIFPPTDEEFKDRRNKLAKKNKTEERAAKHNEKDILRMEGRLRQEGKRVSAVSTDDEENKITHSCKHCGKPIPGEIEHVGMDSHGKKNAVEAKGGEDFYPAKDTKESLRNVAQMERYVALANHSGFGIQYKVPEDHTKAMAQIEKLRKTLGIPEGVIDIIPI